MFPKLTDTVSVAFKDPKNLEYIQKKSLRTAIKYLNRALGWLRISFIRESQGIYSIRFRLLKPTGAGR